MKTIRFILLIALVTYFISACNEHSSDVGNVDEIVDIDNTNTDYESVNSESGKQKLDFLVDADDGWRSETGGSLMKFSKEGDKYYLDWDNAVYDVYFEDDWLTIYEPGSEESEEFVMGECYSFMQENNDAFEICYVHMCATIKEEYWTKYIRVDDNMNEVTLKTSLKREDIERMFAMIPGKFITCKENEDGSYRQTCVEFNIMKDKSFEDGDHCSFWIDYIQDGAEFIIDSVGFAEKSLKTIEFYGKSLYHSQNDATLRITTIDNKRFASLILDNEMDIFISEDDYLNLDPPDPPCEEYDEEYY